ncbi:MAG: hypothetical protein KGL39_42685 [Patescibacteria group bacterium]|nr:hypothetical protein [Patescibacteria group bacterium]
MKLTNPKDAIGVGKLPMHLVPTSVAVYASLAFLEGALKYGKFNWRVAGVRFSVYLDAMLRHLVKLADGEWADATTQVPHLASVIACCGILLDARDIGKLTDDRAPAKPGTSAQVDELQRAVSHLKSVFRDCQPHQFTITDATSASRPRPRRRSARRRQR